MVWKELFIDRVGTLGKFGRWFGVLLVLALGGGSLVGGGRLLLGRHDQRNGHELGGSVPDLAHRVGRLLGPLRLFPDRVGRGPPRRGLDLLGARAGDLGRPPDQPPGRPLDRGGQALGEHVGARGG